MTEAITPAASRVLPAVVPSSAEAEQAFTAALTLASRLVWVVVLEPVVAF